MQEFHGNCCPYEFNHTDFLKTTTPDTNTWSRQQITFYMGVCDKFGGQIPWTDPKLDADIGNDGYYELKV